MCGIVGIHNHSEAANLAYLCLYSQQHRGQESAGITSSDNGRFYMHKAMGLVADCFDETSLKRLIGKTAIGHVRYSTTGESSIENAQPFVVNAHGENLAIVHNGNLTNTNALREDLENTGTIFQSSMDTEVIMQLVARVKGDMVERIVSALKVVEGAYSLLFLSDSKMIAVRDPLGFRPLSIGELDGAYVVASESCAFDLVGAKYLRDVEPGEIVVFEKGKMNSFKGMLGESVKKSFCIFEYVYFARPDSRVFGRDVYSIRKILGSQLAVENPVAADIVVPVPDSGVPAAIGFSQQIGIPFEMALIRSHYVGRTFIEPESEIRHFGVKLKLNPVKEMIRGKRVVIVDDSIVRGTTSQKIVKMLRSAGAKEIHLRISSPPNCWPCFYGIDTPNKDELVASRKSIEDICKFVTADSLGYLSTNGLFKFGEADISERFCTACFTGQYPCACMSLPR